MIEGLAITIEIGTDEIRGWLPMLPDRLACIHAISKIDGDDRRAAALLAAAVGLCWGGPPLSLVRYTTDGPVETFCPPGPRALLTFDGSLHEFGDAVFHALMLAGYDHDQIFACAKQIFTAFSESIPTVEEVETAADFTEGTPTPCT